MPMGHEWANCWHLCHWHDWLDRVSDFTWLSGQRARDFTWLNGQIVRDFTWFSGQSQILHDWMDRVRNLSSKTVEWTEREILHGWMDRDMLHDWKDIFYMTEWTERDISQDWVDRSMFCMI